MDADSAKAMMMEAEKASQLFKRRASSAAAANKAAFAKMRRMSMGMEADKVDDELNFKVRVYACTRVRTPPQTLTSASAPPR